MAKDKKLDSGPPGCPLWMLTFGDCMSLLLTFFVMILSFTSFEKVKIDAALGSFRRGVGIFGGHKSVLGIIDKTRDLTEEDMERISFLQQGYLAERVSRRELVRILRQLDKKFKGRGLYPLIKIFSLQKRVSIRIHDVAIFEKGHALFKENAYPFLKEISSLIKHLPNDIIIEAYTYSDAIKNSTYSSPWDLSVARATAVAEFLTAHGTSPKNIGVSAFADTFSLSQKVDGNRSNIVEILIKTDSQAIRSKSSLTRTKEEEEYKKILE